MISRKSKIITKKKNKQKSTTRLNCYYNHRSKLKIHLSENNTEKENENRLEERVREIDDTVSSHQRKEKRKKYYE